MAKEQRTNEKLFFDDSEASSGYDNPLPEYEALLLHRCAGRPIKTEKDEWLLKW